MRVFFDSAAATSPCSAATFSSRWRRLGAGAGGALELEGQLGELSGEGAGVADDRFRAVGRLRGVLDGLRAEILLDGLLGLLGVEGEVVVLDYGLLVALHVAHGRFV